MWSERRDRVRNEKFKRKCGLQKNLSEKGEASLLRRCGHIEG